MSRPLAKWRPASLAGRLETDFWAREASWALFAGKLAETVRLWELHLRLQTSSQSLREAAMVGGQFGPVAGGPNTRDK